MGEQIVDEKTEFTPNGVVTSWRAVKIRECRFEITVRPSDDARYILIVDEGGVRVAIEIDHAPHIAKLIANLAETMKHKSAA